MKTTISNHFARAGLPDNLPLCLSKIARNLPPEFASLVDLNIASQKIGFFDRHPAMKDRIAASRRQNAPGIFQLARPAKVLLRDSGKHCEKATFLIYKRLMGKSTAGQHLTPTEMFLAQIKFDSDGEA